MQLSTCFGCKSKQKKVFADQGIRYAASMKNEMEVYFTSPILGQIFGRVIAGQEDTYRFIGKNVLVNIELKRLESGWICEQEQWLHDSQVQEIGEQIDKEEEWSSAK